MTANAIREAYRRDFGQDVIVVDARVRTVRELEPDSDGPYHTNKKYADVTCPCGLEQTIMAGGLQDGDGFKCEGCGAGLAAHIVR